MYQVGDQVLYGIHGVCRITETEVRTIGRSQDTYYVLQPLDQPETRFYIPSGNPAAVAKLRRMLSQGQLLALLGAPEIREDSWIDNENLRKQRYRELIGGGDRVSLLRMVGTLYRQRDSRRAAGRKLHQCDENFLRDAEKILYAEISAVMHIPPEKAPAFLTEQFQCVQL